MGVNKTFIEYVFRTHNCTEVAEIIQTNNLSYILEQELPEIKLDFFLKKEYYEKAILKRKEFYKVIEILDKNKINYITFKGIVLANRLYDKWFVRKYGDVDIYIENDKFCQALEAFRGVHFYVARENGLNNKHHVVLSNGKVIVELHRNILNPQLKIDETYLRNNLLTRVIFEQKITTFNETATFLHLLYHLYMDMVIGPQFVKTIYEKKISMSKKFFFRAYEIALYSEKYYDQINWKDIIIDIQRQNLKSYFKSMIHGILNIFPQAFPEFFIEAINEKDYEMTLEDVDQIFCEYFVKHNDYECTELIEKFINEKWNGSEKLNLTENSQETFSIRYHHWKVEEEFENDADFKCTCTVINRSNKIEMFFEVLQEDICFSEENQLDDSETDGIHLFLCSTHKFLYRSIFLFPKIICGETKVIAIDAVTNEGVEDLICNLEITSNGYHLGIFLNAPFIKKNLLESNFYLGAIAAKCCPNTGKRIRELTMSPRVEYWYSPTWFAKVEW